MRQNENDGRKPNGRAGGFVIAILIATTVGGLGWQRAQMAALRSEAAVLRLETAEWTRLRDENQRLRAKQVPAAEMERLRSDHAALPRLRAELAELKHEK